MPLVFQYRYQAQKLNKYIDLSLVIEVIKRHIELANLGYSLANVFILFRLEAQFSDFIDVRGMNVDDFG